MLYHLQQSLAFWLPAWVRFFRRHLKSFPCALKQWPHCLRPGPFQSCGTGCLPTVPSLQKHMADSSLMSRPRTPPDLAHTQWHHPLLYVQVEKRLELVKQVSHSTHKKLTACLQGQQGAEADKRSVSALGRFRFACWWQESPDDRAPFDDRVPFLGLCFLLLFIQSLLCLRIELRDSSPCDGPSLPLNPTWSILCPHQARLQVSPCVFLVWEAGKLEISH